MQVFKNLKIIICVLALMSFITSVANSTEECFEKTSRAIFKFNMVIDDIILEPLAKGYNKRKDFAKRLQDRDEIF